MKMAKTKNYDNTKSWKASETLDLSHIINGNVKWYNVEKSLTFFSKASLYLIYGLKNVPLAIYSEK